MGVMPAVPWARGRTTFTRLWRAVVWRGLEMLRAAKMGCKAAEQTTYNKLAVLFYATSPPPFLQSSFLLPSWHVPIHIIPFARSSFPKLYSGSVSPFACQLDSLFHYCPPVAQRHALPAKKASSVLPSMRLLCLSHCCCSLERTSRNCLAAASLTFKLQSTSALIIGPRLLKRAYPTPPKWPLVVCRGSGIT